MFVWAAIFPDARWLPRKRRVEGLGRRLKMKHIRRITARRADAFSDFLNDIQAAWSNFVDAKKNELGL